MKSDESLLQKPQLNLDFNQKLSIQNYDVGQYQPSNMNGKTGNVKYVKITKDISTSPIHRKNYMAAYSNVLQNGSDPILTVVFNQNSNKSGKIPLRKSSGSLILDPDSSLFEEMSSDNWDMKEDSLLEEPDLLGEFDAPI